MNDEWRLQVDPHEQAVSALLLDRIEAGEVEHDLSGAFHDRVIVSRDGDRVFFYAGSREQAEAARELLQKLAAEHGWHLDLELRRWHPVAEEWEDPDRPLPADESARQAEREVLMRAERRETEESGQPEFEVRVDLPSRHDAAHFAERLTKEGVPAVHRWRFLLVGATDEDSAKALAERIRGEAPAGSKVAVEGTWQRAYAEQPRRSFAIFGGLGA